MRALISSVVPSVVPTVAAILVLTSCAPGDDGPDDAAPDDYAAYLVARDTVRRVMPRTVEVLEYAVPGSADTLRGRWETCRQEGDETVAFSYSVTTVLGGVWVEPGLPTVVAALEGQGWVVDQPTDGPAGRQLVTAGRDDGRGIGLFVGVGRPADRLVVRATVGCFEVPEADREELRALDRDAPLT